jgi:hypothetical protein
MAQADYAGASTTGFFVLERTVRGVLGARVVYGVGSEHVPQGCQVVRLDSCEIGATLQSAFAGRLTAHAC